MSSAAVVISALRVKIYHRAAENRLPDLTLNVPNNEIVEFANRTDPDETAHNESNHLDPNCLPSGL